MTEIDMIISGTVGGSIAGLAISWVMLGHIRYCYEEKLKILQIQLAAIRAQLSSDIDNDRR